MITESQYKQALQIVKDYQSQINIEVDFFVNRYDKGTLLVDTEVSVRTLNCLKANTDVDINDFTLNYISKNYSKRQLLRMRNLGQRTLSELEGVLSKAGLKLKKR